MIEVINPPHPIDPIHPATPYEEKLLEEGHLETPAHDVHIADPPVQVEPVVAAVVETTEDSAVLLASDGAYVEATELEGSEIILLPTPIAATNEEAEKLPGSWLDEQKLTLQTFKEIVSTDVDNVWVVAYVDPRCRDCLTLSLEWEKLT